MTRTEEFPRPRSTLFAIAYRILGSVGETNRARALTSGRFPPNGSV